MKRTIAILGSVLLVSSAVAAGCSDDEVTTSAATTTTTTTTSGGGNGTGGNGTGGDGTGGTGGGSTIPAPPALGAQIDRFGRPAINTALNHNFLTDGSGPSSSVIKAGKQDGYNQDDDPSTWVATYQAVFARDMAVLDSLDAPTSDDPADGGCGTQLALGCEPPDNPDTPADWDDNLACYGPLAAILAFDMLTLDGSTTTCTQYLGVEATALGLISDAECGGRKPNYDVIETTYSALAGVPTVVNGFDDGVDADSQSQVEVFPYLAEPFSD